MMDIPQATIARAIAVLRAGPLRAADFAKAMWPERCATRSPGQWSQAGHALLHRLASVGYVARVGDLWTIRTVGTGTGPGNPPDRTADRSLVQSADRPALELPLDLLDRSPVGTPDGFPDDTVDPRVEHARLQRLVQLADGPVDSVRHDGVLGDIEIRGVKLDACVAQACAWVVLRGRTMNVYFVGEDESMFVGLTPIEAARALYLQWQQSGRAPALLDPDLWFFADDGLIASPVNWIPADADEEEWLCTMEPIDQMVYRQRAEAGLA